MVRRVHRYANGGQVQDLGMDEAQRKRVAEMRRQRDAGIAQTRAKFKAEAATAAAPAPRSAAKPKPEYAKPSYIDAVVDRATELGSRAKEIGKAIKTAVTPDPLPTTVPRHSGETYDEIVRKKTRF
jgi:hypothetical protein